MLPLDSILNHSVVLDSQVKVSITTFFLQQNAFNNNSRKKKFNEIVSSVSYRPLLLCILHSAKVYLLLKTGPMRQRKISVRDCFSIITQQQKLPREK